LLIYVVVIVLRRQPRLLQLLGRLSWLPSSTLHAIHGRPRLRRWTISWLRVCLCLWIIL